MDISRSNRPFVLEGLRSAGKTVLRSDFRREAQSRNWIVTQVGAGAGAGAGKTLRESLGEALHAPLADLVWPSAGRRLDRALKADVFIGLSSDTVRSMRNFDALAAAFRAGRGLRIGRNGYER